MKSILFFSLLVLGWLAYYIMGEYDGKKIVNVLCGIGSFTSVSFATYIYIVNWGSDYAELQAPSPIFSIVFDTVLAGVVTGLFVCTFVVLISSIVNYLIEEKSDSMLISTIIYIVMIICIFLYIHHI